MRTVDFGNFFKQLISWVLRPNLTFFWASVSRGICAIGLETRPSSLRPLEMVLALTLFTFAIFLMEVRLLASKLSLISCKKLAVSFLFLLGPWGACLRSSPASNLFLSARRALLYLVFFSSSSSSSSFSPFSSISNFFISSSSSTSQIQTFRLP